ELDLVAVREGDRGRPGEQALQTIALRLRRGARHETVLHDVVLDAERPQPSAQALELGDLQPAVLRDDERRGCRELLREHVDGLALRRNAAALALHFRPRLGLRHCSPFYNTKPPFPRMRSRGRAPPKRRSSCLRRTDPLSRCRLLGLLIAAAT